MIGVLQMVIAGKESVEHLIESAAILKSIESSPSVICYYKFSMMLIKQYHDVTKHVISCR